MDGACDRRRVRAIAKAISASLVIGEGAAAVATALTGAGGGSLALIAASICASVRALGAKPMVQG